MYDIEVLPIEEGEGELVNLKIKSAGESLRRHQEKSTAGKPYIDLEYLKAEIAEVSRRSDNHFLRTYKMKSHNSMKRCLTKAKDYVARVVELQYGYMTINPLLGKSSLSYS